MRPKCAVRWTMCSAWSAPRPRPSRSGRRTPKAWRAPRSRHHDGHHAEQSIGAARTRRAGQCRAEVEGMSQTSSRSGGGGRHHPHFAADAVGPSMPRSRPSTRVTPGAVLAWWPMPSSRSPPKSRPRPSPSSRPSPRCRPASTTSAPSWSSATTLQAQREVHAAFRATSRPRSRPSPPRRPERPPGRSPSMRGP